MTLGQKLRAARQRAGLTQSQTVGDRITRNMLSQIENDQASPSVGTLEYLAAVLDVKLAWLLADEKEEAEADRTSRLRELLRSGDYGGCLALAPQTQPDDEQALALAIAAAQCARHAMEAERFDTAQHLAQLQQLEAERCPSLDRPADAFAQILADAGEGWYSDPNQQKILRQMLYHLGRWIYLIDAADDLEKDAQSGSYNPLRCRFDLPDGRLDTQSRQRLIATLDHSVNLLSSAFALADYGAWTALLENLIYYALPQTGYLVLEGKWNAGQDGTPCAQRLRAAKQRERTEPTA